MIKTSVTVNINGPKNAKLRGSRRQCTQPPRRPSTRNTDASEPCSPGVIPFSLMDVALFLGDGGLFFAAAVRRLSAHALIALKDPRLSESLGLENF